MTQASDGDADPLTAYIRAKLMNDLLDHVKTLEISYEVSRRVIAELTAERDALRAKLAEAKDTRPRCGVAEGSGCDYADECDALRAEIADLRANAMTTLVACARCSLGYRARDMADGRCAECLRIERDALRADVGRLRDELDTSERISLQLTGRLCP